MWAEWMRNYDLSITKEEIEEYKKRKKDKHNKVKKIIAKLSETDADKIFAKLGYTEKENSKIAIDMLVYKNPKTNTRISFGKEYHVVLKTQKIYPKAIDMQELKAINKKVEELRLGGIA